MIEDFFKSKKLKVVPEAPVTPSREVGRPKSSSEEVRLPQGNVSQGIIVAHPVNEQVLCAIPQAKIQDDWLEQPSDQLPLDTEEMPPRIR